MGKQTYRSDIILGDRYLDKQTGIKGTCIGVHFWQHGCERVSLETVKADGEIKEYGFDAPRLTHIDTGVTAKSDRPGGPDKGAMTPRTEAIER